ncbi:hypothetical protein GRAN_3441 [Granulicella sibirica]|uniref:Uncharacterized protein n=1 Tax=Granulicella sibirica TaxID=2479048 RepID=A0A4V1L5Q5_9BACT|nr:hypothetical protein GRAN_3441 [Granulicella sibirica]
MQRLKGLQNKRMWRSLLGLGLGKTRHLGPHTAILTLLYPGR